MKYCLLLIVLGSSYLSSAKTNEVQSNGLKGKVASVTWTGRSSYIRPGGSICQAAGIHAYTTHVTDNKGRQTVCNYYSKDSVVLIQKTRAYNKRGDETEIKSRCVNPDQTWEIRYKYDKKGWPVVTRSFMQGKMVKMLRSDTKHLLFDAKMITRYDTAGLTTDEDHYSENDTILYKRHFTNGLNSRKQLNEKVYDSTGSKKMSVVYDDQGQATRYAVYTYDAVGNEVSVRYYQDSAHTILNVNVISEYDDMGHLIMKQNDGKYGTRQEYEYDTLGNKIQLKVSLLKDGIYNPERIERYNTDGALIEMICYTDEGIVRRTCEYDLYGNLLLEVQYDQDNSIEGETFYKYEQFDKAGNWLKSTNWKDEEGIVQVITRAITYW